jgi:hypothetical protein
VNVSKLNVSDADLLAANQAGQSHRALARQYGVAVSNIGRRIRRATAAEHAQRQARLRAERDRVNERKRLRRRGFEPNPNAIRSLTELQTLAAQAEDEDDKAVTDLRVERPARDVSEGRPTDPGTWTVLWDWPSKGKHAIALDYAAMWEICRSDLRIHWFATESMHAGWLVPGEPASDRNYGVQLQHRVRWYDGSRRRAYVFRGCCERLQVERIYRGVLYDSRRPETGVAPPPPDGTARILGVWRV